MCMIITRYKNHESFSFPSMSPENSLKNRHLRVPRLPAGAGETDSRSFMDKLSPFLKWHLNIVLQRSAGVTLV